MRKSLVTTLYGLIVLSLLSGCAANLASKKRIEGSLPAGARVAVLPFENLSGTDRASEKVTEFFQISLTGQERFTTIEYGAIYEGLRRYRIRSATLITADQIDSLAAFLEVDYLVAGSVLEYEEINNAYLGTVPQVSFNSRLISCREHRTVWVGSSNGRGDKGEVAFGIGTTRSADRLAQAMVQKAVSEIGGLFR